MTNTTCKFWIKFFIWIALSMSLWPVFNLVFDNTILSIFLAFIILFPIMVIDLIFFHFYNKYKIKEKTEEKMIRQEERILRGDNNTFITCPKCGHQTLKIKDFCENCGKDLRTIN